MKKSLSKILARMAKDGDIETVAEIIEEMIEPEATETPAEAVAEAVAEVAPVVAAAAEELEAVIETPETTIVVDEATLGEVISRLDQIISLLQPAATDDDPVGEIAEAVEEALEAVITAEDPITDEDLTEGTTPEEVAGIIEEIMEPISEVLDPAADECGEENQQVLLTSDAIHAALNAVGPTLLRVPEKQRRALGKDLVRRLNKPLSRRGADQFRALAGARRKPSRGNPADLGKRIMATRNINCRK